MVHPEIILAIAVALPVQESDASRVQSLLKDLSDLATRIDAGSAKLAEVRRKDQQPDKAMREIRELLHRDSKLIPKVNEFIRSENEPLAARMIALFATAEPSSQELVLLHCSILDDPPDMNMAQAVLFGYYIACDSRHEDQWREDLLSILPHFGCSPNYRAQGNDLGGHRMQLLFTFNHAPKGVDYRPLLRSLVGFLEKEKHASFRWRIAMAAKMVKEMAVWGPDRIRFAKLVESTYLEGKDGWGAALEALADRGGHCGPDQLEILGRGLANLDAKRKTDVLGEVARNFGHEMFRPPFRDCLDETIEYMGKPRTQNEPMTSTEWSICAMLIRQSLDDSWAERLLIKSSSVTLRRKAIGVMSSLCQTTDRFEWARFARFLERMLSDPDDQVQKAAMHFLEEAISRKTPLFDAARSEELRRKLAASKR